VGPWETYLIDFQSNFLNIRPNLAAYRILWREQ
jgi:hypothetical protein